MYRFLLMMMCLFFVSTVSAQKANIIFNGKTENGAGKTVMLIKYSDPLTHEEVVADRAEIGDDGSFHLEGFANYPTLMVIQIENYTQSLVAEPGRIYEMYLPEFNWNIDEQQNVSLAPVALPFQFLNLPKDEVNISVARFDEVVDSFVYANRLHFDFKFRADRSYFDTLVQLLNTESPETSSEYFNRYRLYRLATIEMQFGFASRTRLYDSLIRDKQILYYDDNYMSFFLEFYHNRISKGNRYLSQRTVAELVERQNFANFVDSVGLDPLLRNEQVRELAILQAMSEAYYRSFYFRPENVANYVRQIAATTKFKEHKTLAESLLERFEADKQVAQMPDFQLPDAEGQLVSLSSFRGKWVYLSFVKVSDPVSMGEMETMAHFYDSVCGHDDNIVFITISCDRESQKMFHLLKNSRKGNRYRWLWLHFDGDYQLLEHYKVVSYPTFILLTPEGRKRMSVTPSPSTGFLTNGPWRNPNQEPETRRFFLDEYKDRQ